MSIKSKCCNAELYNIYPRDNEFTWHCGKCGNACDYLTDKQLNELAMEANNHDNSRVKSSVKGIQDTIRGIPKTTA